MTQCAEVSTNGILNKVLTLLSARVAQYPLRSPATGCSAWEEYGGLVGVLSVGVLSVESSSPKGGGVPQGLLGEGGVPEGLLGKGGIPKGRSSCKRRKSFWGALRDEGREGGFLGGCQGGQEFLEGEEGFWGALRGGRSSF